MRGAWRSFVVAHSPWSVLPFLALVVLAAVLSYRYHVLLQEQRERVDHTYQVITRLQSILVRLIDAETGQRGYVITGSDRYLAPYRDATAQVPDAIASLRASVRDNADQLRRIDALDRLVTAKFAELQETLDVRRSDGAEAAGAVVLGDRGRLTMDGVRDVIATMERSESALLAARSSALEATERRLLAVTIVCAALSLAARVGLAWAARRRRPASLSARA